MPLQLLSEETVLEIKDVDLPNVKSPCEDVTYQVRQIPPPLARAMAKRHTKRRPNPQTHQMEEQVDVDALSEEAIDYVVVGWSGVVLPDGTPAPCTKDNKVSGLDAARKIALTNIAGSNSGAAEARAESFRQPA